MNFRLKLKPINNWFLFLFGIVLLLTSCSTYRIADKFTSKKLHQSGLTLKKVNLGNYHIEYWDSAVDKPTLMLIHGFGASSQFQWFKQTDVLKDSFRLILPNLIYFGESKVDTSICDVMEQAEALKLLLDYLQIKSYSLCGASYGGNVAVELANLNPQNVNKLILFDTPVKYMSLEDINHIYEHYHVKSLGELLIPSDYKKLTLLLKVAFLNPPKVPAIFCRSIYKELYTKQATGQK